MRRTRPISCVVLSLLPLSAPSALAQLSFSDGRDLAPLRFPPLALTATAAMDRQQKQEQEQDQKKDQKIEEIAELEDLLGEEEEEIERPFFRLDPEDFIVTGFAFSTFRVKDDSRSRTSIGVSPVVLWKINDRMLIEMEIEMGWSNISDRVVTEVEYLNLSYLVSDYLTFSAGKFLVPFGLFSERLHPAWINKLPDGPLPLGHSGLVPGAAPGVMARGGFSFGSSKFNYAAYLVSGPQLTTKGGSAGRLDFAHGSWNWLNNESDSFTNLAFGGRVGYLPAPEWEFGYSLYVVPKLAGDVDAVVQGFDVSFGRDIDFLKGYIDVRLEWLWSDVDDRLYGTAGQYFSFNNNRNGGYAQVAYRPTKADIEFLRDFEAVVRYDRLAQPERSGGTEQRWTLGMNYWFTPSTVVKFAYQIDDKRGGNDQNAFFIQFGWGLSDILGVFKK